MGIDVARTKVTAFTLTSVLAKVAGMAMHSWTTP